MSRKTILMVVGAVASGIILLGKKWGIDYDPVQVEGVLASIIIFLFGVQKLDKIRLSSFQGIKDKFKTIEFRTVIIGTIVHLLLPALKKFAGLSIDPGTVTMIMTVILTGTLGIKYAKQTQKNRIDGGITK